MGIHCSKEDKKTSNSKETETSTPKSQENRTPDPEPASKPLRITIINSSKRIRTKEFEEDRRQKVPAKIDFSSKEDIREFYQFNPNVIGTLFKNSFKFWLKKISKCYFSVNSDHFLKKFNTKKNSK